MRKPLARCPSTNHVHGLNAEPRAFADFLPRHLRCVCANHGTFREIEFMRGAMDGIEFNGGGDIETGLLESKAQPAGSGEEIDDIGPTGGAHLGRRFAPQRMGRFFRGSASFS